MTETPVKLIQGQFLLLMEHLSLDEYFCLAKVFS